MQARLKAGWVTEAELAPPAAEAAAEEAPADRKPRESERTERCSQRLRRMRLDRGRDECRPGRRSASARSPGELKPVAELIRFVVGPAGEVVPDVKRKLPGRGIWVTATRTAIENAIKRNVFARGFKQEVRRCPRSGGANRTAARTRRARRARDRRQGRYCGRRFRQGRSGGWPRRHRWR